MNPSARSALRDVSATAALDRPQPRLLPARGLLLRLGLPRLARLGWRRILLRPLRDTGSLLAWLAVLQCLRVRARSEAPSRPAGRSRPQIQIGKPTLPEHGAIASQAGDGDGERLLQTSKTGEGRAPVRSGELEPGDGGTAAVPADDLPGEGVGLDRPGDSQLITRRANNPKGIPALACLSERADRTAGRDSHLAVSRWRRLSIAFAERAIELPLECDDRAAVRLQLRPGYSSPSKLLALPHEVRKDSLERFDGAVSYFGGRHGLLLSVSFLVRVGTGQKKGIRGYAFRGTTALGANRIIIFRSYRDRALSHRRFRGGAPVELPSLGGPTYARRTSREAPSLDLRSRSWFSTSTSAC